MSHERTEWAELWPDGDVRPVHHNATPVGWPCRRPPYAHKGTKWVRRTVTYSEWEVEDRLWRIGDEHPMSNALEHLDNEAKD